MCLIGLFGNELLHLFEIDLVHRRFAAAAGVRLGRDGLLIAIAPLLDRRIRKRFTSTHLTE
jgi:hypothetical protein